MTTNKNRGSSNQINALTAVDANERAAILGVEGQLLFQANNQEFYVYTSGVWVKQTLPATTGSIGPIGPVGPSGQDGQDGAVGPQGPRGNTGAAGTNGTNGVGSPGPQGQPGVQGTQGTIGRTGPAGQDSVVAGPTGPSGATGPQGVIGTPGTNGTNGLPGTNGSDGNDGTNGTNGTVGPQGVKGDKGDQGIPGTGGTTGSVGQQGIQGNQGIQGIQGIKGDKGDQGAGLHFLGTKPDKASLPATGATEGDIWLTVADSELNVWDGTAWSALTNVQGPQGIQGATGNQGAVGAKGDQGINYKLKGTDLLATIQGKTGLEGDVWIVSDSGPLFGHGLISDGQGSGTTHWHDIGELTGPIGPTGPQGVIGVTGANGTDGTNGTNGTDGTNGTNGAVGAKGDAGDSYTLKGTSTEAIVTALTTMVAGDTWILSDTAKLGEALNYDGTSWNNIGMLRGTPGVQGATGAGGATGATGPAGASSIIIGTETIANIQAKVEPAGNIWLASDSATPGNAYVSNGSANQWVDLGQWKGPQGDPGAIGAAGANGNDGADGTDGVNGNVGHTGPAGQNGSQGQKGDKGDDGQDGVKGDKGVDGADGIDGIDGSTTGHDVTKSYVIGDVVVNTLAPDADVAYLALTATGPGTFASQLGNSVWKRIGYPTADHAEVNAGIIDDKTATPKQLKIAGNKLTGVAI